MYLNFWFEASMKCSNSICKVPKHRSKFHILLPWVTVTLHWVSWLPACIVCLANLLLCSNHHWGHILFEIRDIHDINLIKNICTEKRIRRLKHQRVIYLPGTHHLILSLVLLCTQYEWKLLTSAYQEGYHASLDLQNTHSHNLHFFFVQLWRSSPDQFGNTKRLIKRHMAHPMAIVLKRSRAKGSMFSWRKLETVIRLKVSKKITTP